MRSILAVSSLLLSIGAAQADIIMSVLPSYEPTTVVHVGDEVRIQALVGYNGSSSITGIYEGVINYSVITLYDGQGHSLNGSGGYSPPFYLNWYPVVYSEPGEYTLHYDAFVSIHGVVTNCDAYYRIGHGGSCFGNGGYNASESATLTVLPAVAAVPGPVVGAGLPGLVAACITIVGFARKRRAKMRSAQ